MLQLIYMVIYYKQPVIGDNMTNKDAVKKYRTTEKGKAAAKRAEEKRKTNPERLAYRQRYLASINGRAYNLRRGAKQRASKLGLPFDLSVDWVRKRINDGICEVTKLPFTLVTEETYNTTNNMQPLSPSIDRIDPKLGYVESNCRIVCCIFNMCKHHWKDSDVLNFAKAYLKENES
jgi:hypothetical protein